MVRNRDISGFIGVLHSKKPEVQAAAVHVLGSLGTDATPALITALKKKNRNLRLGVIGALSEIRDPQAISSLIEMTQNPSSEIRWQAVIALGETGDPTAAPAILEALKDPDKYVRYGSAISLVKIGHKPVNETEWAWYFAGMQEWEKITELGSQSVPPLENLLRDLDCEVRIKAVKALGSIGDRTAGPALIRCLGDENRQVRWEAVLACRKCGVPSMYMPRGLCQRPRMKKIPLLQVFSTSCSLVLAMDILANGGGS